jgi:hypothetical protein
MADQLKAGAESTTLDARAIELVTALATEGAAPATLNITTSGLGAGLPSSLPVAYDRTAQAFRSLKALI